MGAQIALRWFAIGLLLPISGCGGGLSTPSGPVVGSPGGGGPPPTQLVNVKVTVTVPPPPQGTKGDYMSYNTASVVIVLTSVNGQGVTGVNPTIINTLPGSHDCTSGKSIVCTATAKGSPGDDVFAVTTYSETNATGSVLSVGNVAATIAANGGGVGLSNHIPLTLEGVIASLKLAVVPNKAKRGERLDASVTLLAYDASGAQIVGPSFYSEPITLTVQGDTNHAFSLRSGWRSGGTLMLRKPTSEIALSYDGNKQASPVTVQASVGGPSNISKNAAFSLTGQRPPPPIGTMYVLNLGKKNGVSAVVTEYDGKAKGNAAPVRTLTLSNELYARSIAVDAAGDLYVGYFDNQYGFSPQTGEPDPHNEIAIYAPNANGNDAPTAVISQDKGTSTTIFPIFMAFDGKDRLVTYGATSVDGNTGDAVLTYSAGATGSVAPAYAWNFASPYLRYSGPTGLALDGAGNFYVNGTLHTNQGSAYGLYENSAANIGNPSSTPVRQIPWDAQSHLSPGLTTNVALNSTGEVFIGNVTTIGSGSASTCQANVNVYASGENGGVKPLRFMTFDGISTTNCEGSRGPLLEFFPTIVLYGTSVFVLDDYNDGIDAFPSSSHGTVKPSLRIAGAATGLDVPISLVITAAQ